MAQYEEILRTKNKAVHNEARDLIGHIIKRCNAEVSLNKLAFPVTQATKRSAY